jgi:hypothetical protein
MSTISSYSARFSGASRRCPTRARVRRSLLVRRRVARRVGLDAEKSVRPTSPSRPVPELGEAAAVAVEQGAAEVRAEAVRSAAAVYAAQRRAAASERDALVGRPHACARRGSHRFGTFARSASRQRTTAQARRVAREQDGRRRAATAGLHARTTRASRCARRIPRTCLASLRRRRSGPARWPGDDHPVGGRRPRWPPPRRHGGRRRPGASLDELWSWDDRQQDARTISMTTPPMPTISSGL